MIWTPAATIRSADDAADHGAEAGRPGFSNIDSAGFMVVYAQARRRRSDRGPTFRRTAWRTIEETHASRCENCSTSSDDVWSATACPATLHLRLATGPRGFLLRGGQVARVCDGRYAFHIPVVPALSRTHTRAHRSRRWSGLPSQNDCGGYVSAFAGTTAVLW